MRPKTIVLFLIAVGCGLVASIGVSQYMQQASGSPSPAATSSIFVAVTDVNIGEKLDAQNVRLEEWPKDRVPDGAITELSELEDRFPRTRLYQGEPILSAKLMDGSDRDSVALTIPKGYRVVAVDVNAAEAVSGMVQPGDRVDLIIFLRKNAEIPETGTRTILKDVNIFSVDGETERRMGEDGTTFTVRTVSLLVKPAQAEAVMLAKKLGELSLTLRRPDDTTDQNSEGVTVQSLLGNDTEDPGDRGGQGPAGVAEVSDNAGFIDWLSSQATETPTTPQLGNSPDAVAMLQGEPAWTMQILTSTGYREFRWRDVDELPEEVTLDSGENGAPEPAQQLAPPVAGVPVGNTGSPLPVDGLIGGGDEEDSLEDEL